MKIKKSLAAHSLLYALILLIFISGLLSIMMYGFYWKKQGIGAYVKEIQLEQHLKSAIAIIEEHGFADKYRDNEYRRIIDSDSLVINLRPYGGYYLVTCRAYYKNIESKANYLFGSRTSTDTTFELLDRKSPLVLVGKTRISGKIKLPKSGIKYGTIGKNYYSGDRIDEEDISYSKTELELNSDWKKLNVTTGSKDNYFDNIDANTVNRIGFSDETVVLSTQSDRTITDTLKGNYTLINEKEIRVGGRASLYNVVIKAPKVIIEENFRGTIHIVSDSIMIGKNAVLYYPSSITTLPVNRVGEVRMSDNVKFGGNLVALGDNDKLLPIIRIGQNSKFIGEIYSNGYVEHNGKVQGKLTAGAFIHYERGGTYINYLVDGVIEQLPIQQEIYAGQLFGENKKLKYIQQLP